MSNSRCCFQPKNSPEGFEGALEPKQHAKEELAFPKTARIVGNLDLVLRESQVPMYTPAEPLEGFSLSPVKIDPLYTSREVRNPILAWLCGGSDAKSSSSSARMAAATSLALSFAKTRDLQRRRKKGRNQTESCCQKSN